MTPLEAVRAFCTDCIGGNSHDVGNCGGDKCKNGGCDEHGICWFFRYRLGKGRPSVKLMRRMCLFCQGEAEQFVRECSSTTCPLHPFRMGKNPNRKGMGGSTRNSLKKEPVSGGFRDFFATSAVG